MRYYLVILLIFFLVNQNGFGDNCDNENQKVRLTNNGSNKADIQIKTSGGNTENINNIELVLHPLFALFLWSYSFHNYNPRC